jgi:lysylphosphatidylglycerol synthetase-like protein (DUF2156 family)
MAETGTPMGQIRNAVDRLLDRNLPDIPSVDLQLADRLAAVERHGSTPLAYSTAIQSNLRYFGSSGGYIAFSTKMGCVVALSDPVAPPDECAILIRAFIAAAGSPAFAGISEETAQTVERLGYRINIFGIENRIRFGEKHFAGQKGKAIRYSGKWLEKNGYTIEEHDSGNSVADVQTITADWRNNKAGRRRETAFLNRGFDAITGEGVRRFVLYDPERRPVSFMDLDPVYQGGAVRGFLTAFKRTVLNAATYTEVGLTKHICDRLRDEGLEYLELGMSPLVVDFENRFRESAAVRAIFRSAFRSGWVNRKVFNFQGQAAFKRRLYGETRPCYFATRGNSVFAAIALARLCRMI